MSDNSTIEWLAWPGRRSATVNVIGGCSKISPGCTHCYAIRQAHRMAGNPNERLQALYAGTTHRRLIEDPDCETDQYTLGEPQWTGEIHYNIDPLLRMARVRRPHAVFLCSLSDWGHEGVPGMLRMNMLSNVRASPQHLYMALTKRAAVVSGDLRWYVAQGGGPIPNLIAGFSAEDQTRLEERWEAWAGTPVAVTMVSAEPLLGPLTLPLGLTVLGQRAWVVCGFESGPGRRPFNLDHARRLRDQCREAGVPFFMKQIDKKTPIPADLLVREFPQMGAA